ncbi:hypothetical protein P3X46_012603 [Hevea brasiliensis]|uniref:Large ribosomal subunit protein bL12 C-terminal domain-containing protein n=1 Tax=Hevea brasiliensis TaxID=3981 RepID=A0ABQ9MBV6_HEVBR|nr:hypothetical protein P3X46_012603 [Hevea brasiliensis]
MRSKSLTRFFTFSAKPIFRSLCTASATSSASGNRTPQLERIADELLNLTKLERHDYAILFRPAAPGSAMAEGKPAAEKTAYNIKLEKFDAAAKIKIIKEVRTFTDLGLKEAKDLVEKVPVILKKGITKEEGNPILEKLKELGATVVLE